MGLLVMQGFLGAKAPLEPAICVRIQRKLDSGALAWGFWEEMVFWVPKPVIPTSAFAAFATLVCQIYCFFPAKAQSSRIRRSRILGQYAGILWRNLAGVSAFETGTMFPNSAKAGFGGFGSRLLVRQGFLGAKAGHSDRAVRQVEESCFGFLIAGGLYSKPGRSLCERIKLTFATAPGCLHSLSLGRHDCFGRLCNLGLPKTLRFSLQRQKAQEFCKAEFLG